MNYCIAKYQYIQSSEHDLSLGYLINPSNINMLYTYPTYFYITLPLFNLRNNLNILYIDTSNIIISDDSNGFEIISKLDYNCYIVIFDKYSMEDVRQMSENLFNRINEEWKNMTSF